MDKLSNHPQCTVPLLGFAAYSGTGKTTLLTKLIPLLVARGIRVGLIKHSHHDIEMDKPGKDSYRLREAGASQLVLAGAKRSICFMEHQQQQDRALAKQVELLDLNTLDLILVEGYRDVAFTKIELNRSELGKDFFYTDDENIIALVCDKTISDCVLPQFQFQQVQLLADFICQQMLD